MSKFVTKKTLKKLLAALAIIALMAMILATTVPPAQGLELEFDTSALEEQICEDLGGDGVIQCSDEDASSFTNFEGEFAPPEAEGYAEGITKTGSAREFIVNVTNFVLGFLGLAAVIVIIYGGILYVTAAGEEERAGKGKKSITYAIIGLIIVLMSYALVNTIIGGAASGSDSPSNTLYSSGEVVGEVLSQNQSQQMAQRVRELTQEFVNEYTRYANIVTITQAMLQVNQYDTNGLKEFREGFELVLKEADSFSKTADESKRLLQMIDPLISAEFSGKLLNFASYNNKWMQTKILLAISEEEQAGVCQEVCGPFLASPFPPAYNICLADCANNPDGEQFQWPIERATEAIDPFNIGGKMLTGAAFVASAANEELIANMKAIKDDLVGMEGSFTDQSDIGVLIGNIITQVEVYTNESDTPSFPEIEDLREYAPNRSASIQYFGLPEGGSSAVGKTVQNLNQLYTLVKNLQFTAPVITASVKEGNAPLTVTFSGLNSTDPSNQTITDDRYEWDLEGEGFENITPVNGGTVSYTYENLDGGAYRVALRVKSSDPNIASGISYFTLKVNPPSAVIALNATTGFDRPIDDLPNRGQFAVTGAEGKAGITFDASKTRDGKGNANTIINYAYDFGDGEKAEGPDPIANHFYNKEGRYKLTLEVTDQNGVKDRRIVAIMVNSPAADLRISNRNPDMGETITFDASGSLTDFGSITHYKWTITKAGETIYEDEGNESEFDYAFDAPGEYTVTVEVTDSTGNSNAVSDTVKVNSTPPVVSFTFLMPNPAMPGRIVLDGSSSYDPDEGDTLTYLWEISNGTEGVDYSFGEETNSASIKPILDFKKKGEYDIRLTVSDQHEEPLRQSSYTLDRIKINSVLDIQVENPGSSAVFLDEGGLAEVTLELQSTSGISYEMDWGDDDKVETVPVDAVGSPVTVTHTYNKAGTFPVSIKVFDADNDMNRITRNVYIGNGTAPIPIIKLFVDNVESVDSNEITVNRRNVVKLDAGESLDVDGNPISTTVAYTWTLGDGSRFNGKQLTKTYDEKGDFTVTLTLQSQANPTASAQYVITVHVIDVPPRIHGLVVQPRDDELITPLNVRVEVNAEDVDGEIVRYKFWYYDVNNSSEILGEQIAITNQSFLTINTNGDSGLKKTYRFAAEVTDNENHTVSTADELDESELPELEVENGLNKAPKVKLSAEKTQVLVGENVNLNAEATDEDGEIEEYIWDIEGDGFFNNQPTDDASILFTVEEFVKGGIEIRVKVVDDSGANAASNPVRIFIDTLTAAPEAAFLYTADSLNVQFQNNSIADTKNGAELVAYAWDFNTAVDSNGNGVKNDDVDSTAPNPTHAYDKFGSKSVKLTVTDSEGTVDDVMQTVNLVQAPTPVANFAVQYTGLMVRFLNKSKAGDPTIPLQSYAWDFDNDKVIDSEDESPTFTYEAFGIYSATLTVTDELGRSAKKTQRIEVKEAAMAPLVGFLASTPEQSPRDGKVHLSGEQGNVTFNYRAEGAQGAVQFCIDKNVYFDSDSNGKRDDDCNRTDTVAGTYTTDFSKSWGLIVAKLTVTDEKARKYEVIKEIVFDNPPGPATSSNAATSLLPVSQLEGLYIVLTALAFSLMGAKLYIGRQKPEPETESDETSPAN